MNRGMRRRRAGRRYLTGLAATAGLIALSVGAGQASGVVRPRSEGRPAISGSSRSVSYRLASSDTTFAAGGASGISGGALFGGNYPLVLEQPNLSRHLAIVRAYYHIGDTFPGRAKYQRLMADGQTLLVSLDSSGPSYASIAAGDEDAAISTFLDSVNQAAVRHNLSAIYVSFEHEPDNHRHRYLGTPAQFRQAWIHVHRLAASAHLNWNEGGRLHWVLILIHNTYTAPSRYWPGAANVDIVAADGYNSAGCGPAHLNDPPATPAKVFDPLVTFGAAHGIPVFLAEWGSDDIPPGQQATFISEMQSYVANHPPIVGALYWDTHVGNCDYKIDGNHASIGAMATMGQSAALQGHI